MGKSREDVTHFRGFSLGYFSSAGTEKIPDRFHRPTRKRTLSLTQEPRAAATPKNAHHRRFESSRGLVDLTKGCNFACIDCTRFHLSYSGHSGDGPRGFKPK